MSTHSKSHADVKFHRKGLPGAQRLGLETNPRYSAPEIGATRASSPRMRSVLAISIDTPR